jgi:ADP-ribose pyrophosphatase YjhB (NUDIX family)
MHNATLCFLLKDNQVYLATKKESKKGFGQGRFNGYGGSVDAGETIEDAAVREVLEEASVAVLKEDLEKVAIIEFYFTNVPKEKDWDQIVHVYIVRKWKGEPLESEEMNTPQLFDYNKLPAQMWDADKHWIPYVLSGKKIRAKFAYGNDNCSIIEKEIFPVNNL